MKTIDKANFRIGAFWEATKPRLVFLVLWSVTVGFLLASFGPIDFLQLIQALCGSALVAAGTMALNQWMERESDAKMKRTENRPLPSERLKPEEVLFFGIFLSLAGFLELALAVNLLTAGLSALILTRYLFIYTPLKTKTSQSILAGAVPGALPPVMGWAAARGELNGGAWILFAILFVWQLPHFLAIGWVCREDYERAGFRVLPSADATGEKVGRQIMLYCLALHLVSFLPALSGMNGPVYYLGALLLGIWFLASSFKTAFRLDLEARRFFRNSILYLGLLLFLMILDQKVIS